MNVSYKKSVHLKFSPLCNILPVDICETPHSQLPCVSMDGWHMNFSRTSPSRLTEVLGTYVMDLGLKLTEVQCKKISFAGKKLRLLGKINCTVHCTGQFLGNFHLRRVSQRDLSIHHQTTAAQSHRVSRLILMRSQASRTPGYSTSRCSPTTSGTRT